MDGTISPIPRDFLETPVPPPVLPQLAKLATQLNLVAVISGRKAEAIKEIINIPGIDYIGHYGMEWWENNHAVLHPDAETSLSVMRAVAAELEILRSVDGIIIQDKWATISVHYNMVTQPDVAKQQILVLLKKSPHIKNLRLIYEKSSIGILPRINIDKGTAVTRLIRQHCLMGAIYLGDDIGDVPAFRAIRQAKQDKNFDGLSILVTGSETSQSLINEVDFTLDGVRDTESLLNCLVDTTMAQG